VRLDARDGAFSERLGPVDTIRIAFFEPEGYELRITKPAEKKPSTSLRKEGQKIPQSQVHAAADLVFEATVPFRSLGVEVDAPIQFFIELGMGDQVVERIPTEGAIETAVPGDDFELMMWQA